MHTRAHTRVQMYPWTPSEPWTAGHETCVAVGPKGLVIGATI